MGWETRRNGRYYYRKVWRDGTCRSEYVGASETAALIVELDQLDRQRRQQERLERQIAQNQFAELAATPEAVTLLLEQAQSAAAAALEAAGYHQHKRGEWRKKHVNKDKDQDKDSTS